MIDFFIHLSCALVSDIKTFIDFEIYVVNKGYLQHIDIYIYNKGNHIKDKPQSAIYLIFSSQKINKSIM